MFVSSNHLLLWLFLVLPASTSLLANNVEFDRETTVPPRLAPLTVTALRGISSTSTGAFAVTALDAAALRGSYQWTSDDFLKQIPGFSLFRRTSSLVANPTTQGASLRGIGPSAASRSLVLLDGVPLNDAFGGWVFWSQLNLRYAKSVEVVRGGGSAAWGNTALGGVIQIVPRRPQPRTLETQIIAGNQGTWQTSLYGSEQIGALGVAIEARAFSTDGYTRVRKDQRGTVDIASNAHHEVINLVADYLFPTKLRFSARATAFNEKRGNGTPLTRNTTDSYRLHLKLENAPSTAFSWRCDAYAVKTDFSSTFSRVSADRNSELLTLDQYAVPSTTIGGAWRGTWQASNIGTITMGTDWLAIAGGTRERVILAGDDRLAGGKQLLGGIYLEQEWQANDNWLWQAGLRLDYWRSYSGYEDPPNAARREFSNRNQYIINGRAGLSREITSALLLRTAIYQAFRVPTINELYRPFQVGADQTQANAMLDPERLLGAELGLDFTPSTHFEFRNSVFFNTVANPILNVTIGNTPAGGQLRQKRNIERTRIVGWESELSLKPVSEWTLFLRYAFTDARVERAEDQPSLVGKRLVQVPRNVITAGTTYQILHTGPEVTLQGRWTDVQFEDDLNQRPLGSYPLVDVAVQQNIGQHSTFFLAIENLLDRRYPDGITGNGLITEGRPRSYQAGVRLQF
jgi:outer membrane cobalamin receptor